MKTLVIYASPLTKTETSISSLATKQYLKYLSQNKETKIEEVDLNDKKEFQYSLNSNTFTSGEFFGNGNSDFWIDKLKSTDHLVISTSMINFNIPAVLKNFIDTIAVANKTFKYKYDGSGESEGLLNNLRVQIIASQGAPKGWYPFGDHVAYLEGTFNFLGSKVLKPVLVDGTKTKKFIEKSLEQKITEYNHFMEEAAKQ